MGYSRTPRASKNLKFSVARSTTSSNAPNLGVRSPKKKSPKKKKRLAMSRRKKETLLTIKLTPHQTTKRKNLWTRRKKRSQIRTKSCDQNGKRSRSSSSGSDGSENFTMSFDNLSTREITVY